MKSYREFIAEKAKKAMPDGNFQDGPLPDEEEGPKVDRSWDSPKEPSKTVNRDAKSDKLSEARDKEGFQRRVDAAMKLQKDQDRRLKKAGAKPIKVKGYND